MAEKIHQRRDLIAPVDPAQQAASGFLGVVDA
jgi:hypothetical protein